MCCAWARIPRHITMRRLMRFIVSKKECGKKSKQKRQMRHYCTRFSAFHSSMPSGYMPNITLGLPSADSECYQFFLLQQRSESPQARLIVHMLYCEHTTKISVLGDTHTLAKNDTVICVVTDSIAQGMSENPVGARVISCTTLPPLYTEWGTHVYISTISAVISSFGAFSVD